MHFIQVYVYSFSIFPHYIPIKRNVIRVKVYINKWGEICNNPNNLNIWNAHFILITYI